MQHVKALLIKLVMTTVVLWLVLGMFYGVPFGSLFLLSIIITFASYVLGDLFILPKFENWGAVIADFFLIMIIIGIYSMSFMRVDFSILNAAGISAFIISVGEIFFHIYMDKHILNVDNRTGGRGPGDVHHDLQTEFGKDIDEPDSREDN